MSRNIIIPLAVLASLLLPAGGLMAQDQEMKTPEEMALEEADRLEKMLTLLPHQTFFIDSILQHDMRAMHDELQQLQSSGTREYIAFKQVRDKWVAQIDSAYKKVLTHDQWMQYCRSTGKLSKEELKALRAKEKADKKAAKAAAKAKKRRSSSPSFFL